MVFSNPMQPKLPFRFFKLLFFFLAIATSIQAQEICNNGIDDDGDGLIDLNDQPECSCDEIIEQSVIGDFEEYTCCPQNFTTTPGTGAYCLDDGWTFSPGATTDYFNTCGFMGGGILPPVPLPIPSGDGCVGMASIGTTYNELIGFCMPNPLIVNNTYTFGFYLGFGEGGSIDSPLDTEIFLRGTNDCNDFPGAGSTCFLGDPDFYTVTTLPVSGTASDTWEYFETTFVATEPTNFIFVGTDCGQASPGTQYHFIDSIFIRGDFLEENPENFTIEASGDCLTGVTLEVVDPPGSTFQWFLDGVAIEGATTNPYNPIPIENGVYELVVYSGPNCVVSDPLELAIDLEVLEIDETVNQIVCNNDNNGSIDLDPQTLNFPIDYSWSHGPTTEVVEDLSEGIYAVTVTDENGCFGTEEYEIINPDPFETDLIVTQPSNGNPGGAIINAIGGVPPYTYEWSNGNDEPIDNDLEPGIYTVTVTDANGCEIILMFEIYEPISTEEITNNETCADECDGTATVIISGGLPTYSVFWSNGEVGETVSGLCPGVFFYTIEDSWGTTFTDSVLITGNDPILVEAEFDPLLCSDEDSTSIILTVSGGSEPFQYLWSNGEMTKDLINITSGEYSVSVIDSENCVEVQNYIIEGGSPFTLSAMIQNDDCSDDPVGSIDLSVDGGESPYEYIWNNGEITEDLNNLLAGTYYVTVSDASSCSVSDSFIISIPSALNVQADVINVDCFEDLDGSIELSIDGGIEPYEINWESGENTSQLTDLSAGDYAVTITDQANCRVFASYTITENPQILISADLTNPSCAGIDNGVIELTVEGGVQAYSFLWSDGNEDDLRDNLAPGTYDVVVTDNLGCTNEASFELIGQEEIEISANITPTSCGAQSDGAIGIEISGGTPDYSIVWSTSAFTDSIENLSSGIYYVTVSDQNMCNIVDSFEIISGSDITISESITDNVCFGGNIGKIDIDIEGGTAPLSFLWSNNEITQNICDLTADNYSVTVTDANDCSSVASFNINQPDALSIDTLITPIPCFGDQGNIELLITGGTPPYFYNWDDGSDLAEISVFANQVYAVTVTDSEGCEELINFQLDQPDPVAISIIDVQQPSISNDDGSISIDISGGTAPYTASWDDPNMSPGTTIEGLGIGSYSVTVTDINGCTQTEVIELVQEPLSIQLTAFDDPCFEGCDGSIELIATGGILPITIEWSDGQMGATASDLCAGQYDATITDGAGTVLVSELIEIDQPDEITYQSTITQLSCPNIDDGEISIIPNGGTSPLTILWDNGSDQLSISDLSDGDYTFTLTDANDCTSSGIVTIEPFEELQLIAQEIAHDCDENAIIQIIGDIPDGTEILLNNELVSLDQNQSIENLENGNYLLEYQLTDDCRIEFANVEINSVLDYDIILDPTSIVGEIGQQVSINVDIISQTILDNYTIEWSGLNQINCIEEDSNGQCVELSLTLDQSGNLNFTFTDEFGCVFEQSIPIQVNDLINFYVPNAFSPNRDNFNDIFTIFSNQDNAFVHRFEIFDRWGNKVYTESDIPLENLNGWNGSFLGQNATEGVYAYLILISPNNGEQQLIKGDVSLIR